MSRKDFYTIKPAPNGWFIFKVDDSWESTGKYNVSDHNDRLECDCFAGNKHTCRHRDMVRMYKANEGFRAKMNGGAKYNFDKDSWIEPVQTGEV